MTDRRRPPNDDIADANSLFEDEPNWGRKPSHAPPSKPVQPAPDVVPLAGHYDVEGVEPEDDPPPLTRAPIRATRARPEEATERPLDRAEMGVSRSRDDDESSEPRAAISDANVEEVWTRWGEWGPTLTRMGIVGVAVFGLTYLAGSTINFGTAFIILVLGLAILVALSYPIAVTLERPMRLTPEQAVKDFYAAASHHFPHFRRMWLLLSDEGRDSAEFDSYAAFRSYWMRRIARLRGDRVKKTTPLAFVVKEFRSDKSAGQTVIEAEYTVAVHARGSTEKLTDDLRIEGSLVRGPDKMWYLNSGVLPEIMPASRARKAP